MGSSTNQSAVTSDSPIYKDTKKKFKKNALVPYYPDKEEGWESKIKNPGMVARSKQRTLKRIEDKEKKDDFYDDAVGADYDKEVGKANVKKGKRVTLKGFLRMNKYKGQKPPRD